MSSEKKKVLLVDPNPDVRQMLVTLVGKDRLLVAGDFIEGWQLFENNYHELALVIARAIIEDPGTKKKMSADKFVSLVRQHHPGFEAILVNSGDPKANADLVGPKMATHATDGTNLVSLVVRLLQL